MTARASTTGAAGEWKVEHATSNGVLTLKSDKTFTLSKPSSRTLLGWSSRDGANSSEDFPVEDLGGSWDISGNKLSLMVGGSPGQFIMAAGPSLFMAAYKDQRTHFLVLVVRYQ